ncbi:MAG: gluconokinase [Hydrogenophaga sp.]|nr:gluconokinase [Hydrogenophaga sp.]
MAPLRLVVMGVSGCGKSTLAEALGKALALRTVDGDDLHLPESVRKMSAGIALVDDDRWPWLERVASCLVDTHDGSHAAGCVVACSALRRVYRDRLRARVPGLRFVFLDGDATLLQQRMAQRAGHFMQLQLLESQLNTLERPADDETDTWRLAADQPLDSLVAQVRHCCESQPLHAPT